MALVCLHNMLYLLAAHIRYGIQIWKVAVYMLNKQQRTDEKLWVCQWRFTIPIYLYSYLSPTLYDISNSQLY
jgi:type IV secretory pathway TrbD component